MKKLLILFAAVLLSAGLHAQDTSKSKMSTSGKSTKMKDCIMMKNGTAMVEKNGTTQAMTQDMTLSNGTVVMKDGTVKMKDGKTVKLKDGQCIYMDGKIKTMSSSSGSNSGKSPQ